MTGSVVFRVVELFEIVGHSVQSGGLFDVVLREKLRGHSAKLANLAEAVLAADAHTPVVGFERLVTTDGGERGRGDEELNVKVDWATSIVWFHIFDRNAIPLR